MRNTAPTDAAQLEALETREWLDSLDDVLKHGGPARVGSLLRGVGSLFGRIGSRIGSGIGRSGGSGVSRSSSSVSGLGGSVGSLLGSIAGSLVTGSSSGVGRSLGVGGGSGGVSSRFFSLVLVRARGQSEAQSQGDQRLVESHVRFLVVEWVNAQGARQQHDDKAAIRVKRVTVFISLLRC